MRIVYFFTENGAAPDSVFGPHPSHQWSPSAATQNYYARTSLPTEGFFLLWKRLIEADILDEVLIVVESTRSPGFIRYEDKLSCLVVPHISLIDPFLREDDVIFARGGFRSWHRYLGSLRERGHWILFYRADTNRGGWPFWDVIFDDCNDTLVVDKTKRVFLPFLKPMQEELFQYKPMKKVYDLCIGASHIHDKKGQWRGVEAMIAYKKKFGIDLNCVMPGGFYKGIHTNEIIRKRDIHGLSLTIPGMVSRQQLCEYINQSKLLIHLGNSGQNDRAPLEALCCGVPAMIATPHRHASFIKDMPCSIIVKEIDDPETIADEINEILSAPIPHEKIASTFKSVSGIKERIIPDMEELVRILSMSKRADRDYLIMQVRNGSLRPQHTQEVAIHGSL